MSLLLLIGVWILGLVTLVLAPIVLTIPFIGLAVHSYEEAHKSFGISEDPGSNDRPT